MASIQELQTLYGDIYPGTDPVARFMEFHDALDELKPTVDDILSISAQDSQADWAASAARAVNVAESAQNISGVSQESPWFRGSGIIVVGYEAGVLAVSYCRDRDGDDLVEDYHGPYQHVALDKLARAAMMANLTDADPEQAVAVLGTLSERGVPQHLGYTFTEPASGRGRGRYILAGASGMLPSLVVDAALRSNHQAILESDRALGRFTWEHDAQAGYHDLVAAELAVSRLAGRKTGTIRIDELHRQGTDVN